MWRVLRDRGRVLLALLVATSVGTALAAGAPDGLGGWTPMVTWWGAGDPGKALANLNRLTRAFSAVLHHSEVDLPTRKFVDDALEQLGDFDLDDFHELLPEQRDGFRELRVRGDLRGERYVLRRAEAGPSYAVSFRGPRRGLGDLSQLLRAKRIEPEHGPRSYLLHVGLGLGVGEMSWDQTVAAIAELARIVADADPLAAAEPARASADALALTKALHPKLAAEDVAPVALLFDAYPALSRAFSQLGELEDVRAKDSGQGYQHVTVSIRALPERLAQRHAKLAAHLRKLDDVAHFDFRWVDDQGRTLIRWLIDSEQLLFRCECYLKQGKLLPVTGRGKVVLAEQGIDPMSDALARSRLYMHTRVSLFGITITLRDLHADVRYTPSPTHAWLVASVQQPAKVEVEGAAAGLVDALIPGDLQSLTRDFFAHAARGNEKKGVRVAIGAGSESREQGAVIEWSMELEALDSKLVKMGVGMVNDRLMPSGDVMGDAKALLTELHDAFTRDLERYRARLGG